MKFTPIISAILAVFINLSASAQKLKPTATYVDNNKNIVDSETDFEAQAPLDVTFRANPQDIGDHPIAFEWHIRKKDEPQDLLVRYEEDTQYTFMESGVFNVIAKAKFTDTGFELDSVVINITISTSKLEFPNAFSPNDDTYNDIYRAKRDYCSIVEFHAYIFNRWGQKLFEWTDPAEGWDGTFKGHPVKDGVYFVLVKAKGADGIVYNIRKDVNLLRGFSKEKSNTTP